MFKTVENMKRHIRELHESSRIYCAYDGCRHRRSYACERTLKMHLKRDHGPEVKKATCKSAPRTKQLYVSLRKLSGLAVNKDLEKLLREREETALAEVTAKLGEIQNREDEIVNADGEVRVEDENVLRSNKEKRVNEGKKNTEEFTTDVNEIEKCGNQVSEALEADEQLEVQKLFDTACTILAKLDTI